MSDTQPETPNTPSSRARSGEPPALGSGSARTEVETAVAEEVKGVLRGLHMGWADDAIVGPDAHGRFPAARVEIVPPVIVDANVLRNDITYACRNEESRTILVNAANTGFIRLFCAAHVVGEVADHFEEWCDQTGVEVARFESVWTTHYLPLLRLVAEIPQGLLSANEEKQIGILARTDPDDVPSATLALLIGGFYLSEDIPATTAVYGRSRTPEQLREWRQALAAGGDAGAIYSMFEAAIVAARLAGMGLGGLISAGRALPPWLQGVAAATAATGAFHAWQNFDVEHRKGLARLLEQLLHGIATMSEIHQGATIQLDAVCAAMPSMEDLLRDRSAQDVLTRASLRELARSRCGILSASEIAQVLPRLHVPHGEGKIREAMRGQSCATEASPGRWQLGEPVDWPVNSAAK